MRFQKLQAIELGHVFTFIGRTKVRTFAVFFGAIALEDQQRFKREVMRRIVCLQAEGCQACWRPDHLLN